MELYHSHLENRKAKLPTLNVQYADYAIWERENLSGPALEEKLNYWAEKLNGLSPLELTTDYARPAIQSINGASIRFQFDEDLTKSLREVCHAHGVTMFMLLLSVYKILLHRYSGQKDICVGTTVANRPQQEITPLIGFFVNAFALRTDLSSDPTFLEILQQVKETTLEAYTNVAVPFSKVVERVEKKRDQSRSPLFQVLFVLNNNPSVPHLNLGDLKLEVEGLEARLAKFDLSLFATDTSEGIWLTLGYCSDLYSSQTIEQLIKHYKNLMSAVVAAPLSRLSELLLLDNKERETILRLHEIPELDHDPTETLISLFRKQVLRTPNVPAVIYGDQALNYQTLDEQSDKLGWYLRKTYKIQPNDLIGIMLKNSDLALLAILGVLKSGAGYVPIDKELPKSRKSFIISDTGIKALIIESESLLELFDQEINIFSIDIQMEELVPLPLGETWKIRPNDLAYVIFTSGSTGKPKGVMITHENLVDYVIGLQKSLPLEKNRTFGLMSTICADLGNTVLYGSLLTGGSLHVFSKNKLMDADYMQKYFLDHEIDCIKIVPSHWEALQTPGGRLLPKRLLIFGGERLSVGIVEKINDWTDELEIVNHYGPTEGTIGKLLHRISRDVSYDYIPIGQPVFGYDGLRSRR